MSHSCKIAFIGGDLRQYFMVNDLIDSGYEVTTYGFDGSRIAKSSKKASSLINAMETCDVLVCPVPFSKDKKTLYSLVPLEDLTVLNFKNGLRENHVVFGGNISDCIREHCYEHDISCHDFLQMDEVSIGNAIATAEGTIVEAITRSTCNLHKSNCLILGYGKCAKILADKLLGLSANVTICARNKEALAFADAYGYQTLPINELEGHISQFEFIFNSIPSLVLNDVLLKKVYKEVTIIDIASKPGGTDFNYCKEHQINASLCLSLPGKYSPKTSGDILNSVLKTYL